MLALVMALSLTCNAFAASKDNLMGNVTVEYDSDKVDVRYVRIAFLTGDIHFVAFPKKGYEISKISTNFDGVIFDGTRNTWYDPATGVGTVFGTPGIVYTRDYTITIEATKEPDPVDPPEPESLHKLVYTLTDLNSAKVTCSNRPRCLFGPNWEAKIWITASDIYVGDAVDAQVLCNLDWIRGVYANELSPVDNDKIKFFLGNVEKSQTDVESTAGIYTAKYEVTDGITIVAEFEVKEVPLAKYYLTLTNANVTGYAESKVYKQITGQEAELLTPIEAGNDDVYELTEGDSVVIVYTAPWGYKFSENNREAKVENYRFVKTDFVKGIDENTTKDVPAVEKIVFPPYNPPKPVEPEEPAHNTVVIEIGKKAEENGEANPDTGAPSMNLAAVAVVLGAAVVVSKKH